MEQENFTSNIAGDFNSSFQYLQEGSFRAGESLDCDCIRDKCLLLPIEPAIEPTGRGSAIAVLNIEKNY